MLTIIIIYAVGVLLNALIALSIYKDLIEDNQLERVRVIVLTLFILASFLTWLYMIGYLLVKFIVSLFKKTEKDGEEKGDK